MLKFLSEHLKGIRCSWPLYFFALIVSASAGPKVLPVLNHPIKDRSGLAGFPFTVNLNAAFGTEAIDDQVVRFTSQFTNSGLPVTMDMALFSNRTPGTRQNFLNYVANGRYADSFIHRSIPGFVIQGGASRIVSNAITPVVTDPPIVNEFGISNTLGTISMAKSDGDPDSATSQWFVSLGENSENLDTQNGGFTVFGRMTKDTLGNALIFGDPSIFPVYDYSSSLGAIYTDLPLFYTHVPPNPNVTELILFPEVALAPLPAGQAGEDTTLTYSVFSNTNPALVGTSVQAGGILSLTPAAGQTGSTTITVRATDSVGNTVDDVFNVTVNLTDTYATWASRNSFANSQSGMTQNPDGDAWSNLQEFAFLGDPGVSEQDGQGLLLGVHGIVPAARSLTMTFPVRKMTTGLSYSVEANDELSGIWTEIWNSVDGFSHAQVLSIVVQTDRTIVTIKDTAVIGAGKRFLRVKTVQE